MGRVSKIVTRTYCVAFKYIYIYTYIYICTRRFMPLPTTLSGTLFGHHHYHYHSSPGAFRHVWGRFLHKNVAPGDGATMRKYLLAGFRRYSRARFKRDTRDRMIINYPATSVASSDMKHHHRVYLTTGLYRRGGISFPPLLSPRHRRMLPQRTVVSPRNPRPNYTAIRCSPAGTT